MAAQIAASQNSANPPVHRDLRQATPPLAGHYWPRARSGILTSAALSHIIGGYCASGQPGDLAEQRHAWLSGGEVVAGVDHAACSVRVSLDEQQRRAIAADF